MLCKEKVEILIRSVGQYVSFNNNNNLIYKPKNSTGTTVKANKGKKIK